MQIKTVDNANGRTLVIRADESLDCQIHSDFSQAAIVASYPWIKNIEIDLRSTTIIRDSGLSILSMLSRKSGLQRNHIKLVNCRPEIRARLRKCKLVRDLLVA
jgi:anti-anti-sigma regulatory factor